MLGCAERRCRKIRGNLPVADCQQVAHQGEALAASGESTRAPVEHRTAECALCQWVWYPIPERRIGLAEFRASALAHRSRKRFGEVTKEWKRGARPPFLAHEQERRHGCEQRDRERRRKW